jgi:hypothetical protein
MIRELAHLHAADVVDAAGIVRVADNAVRHVVDLAGDVAEVRHEAVPLRGDAGVRLVIALAQAEYEYGVSPDDPRRWS